MSRDRTVMHNVYFWMKPDADKELMEKGLRLLGTVPVVIGALLLRVKKEKYLGMTTIMQSM